VMNFDICHIYHIYNQGNNRQRVFFNEGNYVFFIKKIKRHVMPYADILAWCLMPNHFHLMAYVREVEVLVPASHGFTLSEAMTKPEPKPEKPRTLNDSIGIMLRSYTRAINKQEGFSGALFRPQTKAICLSEHKGITPAFVDTKTGTMIYRSIKEKEYPLVCFNYIHQNPVQSKLAEKAEDWPYSSAPHYAGLIDDGLTCLERAKELGLA